MKNKVEKTNPHRFSSSGKEQISRERTISRRELIKNTVLTACAFSVSNFTGISAFAQGKGNNKRNTMKIPDVVAPFGLALTCAPDTSDLGGNNYSNVLAYNGSFPGPTLVARKGDTVSIDLYNGLSEKTITHWHGMVVDYENDGGPRLTIDPNEVYHYRYPIIQRACLNFYHPHPHGLTGKQVNLGLAGAFIVRDSVEDKLNLPSEQYEVPLIIRDATLDSKGNLVYQASSSGFKGKIPLVNGTRDAVHYVDKGFYRFRVLNGANARVFRIALSNGAPFVLIGNDGGLIEFPAVVSQITFGPGERLDLLVDFSTLQQGASVKLHCLDAKWDLVEFVSTGNSGYQYSVPQSLSLIPKLYHQGPPTRIFSFDGMDKINGKTYEHNRIDFSVPFKTNERWRFVTGGNAPHPVHVHGASFQVISRTGGRNQVFPWEQGWKDTVLLLNQETVDVLIRFEHYKGLYVIHCHQLEHEDAGMMSNFEVV